MASRTLIASTALLLCLNLLFSTLVSSTYCPPTPSTPSVPKVHKSPPSKNPYPNPKPNPKPSPSPSPSKGSCPRDTLKLAACANVLNGLVNLVVGTPPVTPCCELISGIADLEAALCLCTAIKANVLGINLNVSVALSLVLNNCGKKVPDGFQCA